MIFISNSAQLSEHTVSVWWKRSTKSSFYEIMFYTFRDEEATWKMIICDRLSIGFATIY